MMSIAATAGHVPSWPGALHAASLLGREPSRGEVPGAAPVVHIVDLDDDAKLLSGWVRAAGMGARNYAMLGDFMDAQGRDTPSCLVVDARIARGTHGDLGSLMQRLGARCPIVVTAYGADVPTAVLAMKTGAIDFVEKPFLQRDILEAIEAAIRIDGERRLAAARAAALNARFATLSRRERQVMALVTTGRLNKQVAGDLGLSEVTVKAHRGAAMRKMAARSVADLVRMADALGEMASAATDLA